MTSDGILVPTFKTYKAIGLANHVFTEDNLKKLYSSNIEIGHLQYTTAGN